jgi:hypothetical protein
LYAAKLIGLLLGSLLLGSVPALAQRTGAQRVEAIRAAYQRFDYAAAQAEAEGVLEDYAQFSSGELVEVHTLLALIAYAQHEPVEARAQFLSALSLDPELELDPLLVSPKILAFFEEVKAEAPSVQPADAGATAATRYVLVSDPRPAAALRSMLVPGWGQLYKGETTKGYVLMGLGSAMVLGAATAQVLRARAEDDYLAEQDPALIEDRYEAFDRWHKARNGLLLGAAAVWAYAFVDALIVAPPAVAAHSRLRIAPGPSLARPQVSFELHF